jgi:hypothetical protein
VPAASYDRNLIVRAVVTLAKANGDTSTNSAPWLTSQLANATTRLIAGATVIKSLSLSGLNATGDNEMPTVDVVEIFQQALDSLIGGGAANGPMVLIPRLPFSGIPI